LARPYFSSTIFDPSLCSNTRKASRAILRASSCVASDGIALVMLVVLGSIVGQHKTGRSLLASLRQRKACCSSSIQCNTRRDTGAASVATCIKSTISLQMQVLSKSINQSTNQYIQCPRGQLGPNRQQAQFAFYMQSIP